MKKLLNRLSDDYLVLNQSAFLSQSQNNEQTQESAETQTEANDAAAKTATETNLEMIGLEKASLQQDVESLQTEIAQIQDAIDGKRKARKELLHKYGEKTALWKNLRNKLKPILNAKLNDLEAAQISLQETKEAEAKAKAEAEAEAKAKAEAEEKARIDAIESKVPLNENGEPAGYSIKQLREFRKAAEDLEAADLSVEQLENLHDQYLVWKYVDFPKTPFADRFEKNANGEYIGEDGKPLELDDNDKLVDPNARVLISNPRNWVDETGNAQGGEEFPNLLSLAKNRVANGLDITKDFESDADLARKLDVAQALSGVDQGVLLPIRRSEGLSNGAANVETRADGSKVYAAVLDEPSVDYEGRDIQKTNVQVIQNPDGTFKAKLTQKTNVLAGAGETYDTFINYLGDGQFEFQTNTGYLDLESDQGPHRGTLDALLANDKNDAPVLFGQAIKEKISYISSVLGSSVDISKNSKKFVKPYVRNIERIS